MADYPTISLIIPTISRPTLARTLKSIRGQEWRVGDEVLLVGDGSQPVARALWEQFGLPGKFFEVPGPSKDWGHTPRNLTHWLARGSHLMALDDDDEMVLGALALVRNTVAKNPNLPHLFRMSGHPAVGTVWKEKFISLGNVSTPIFLPPNISGRIGKYTPRYGGDHDFIKETCSHYEKVIWCEDVICQVRPK